MQAVETKQNSIKLWNYQIVLDFLLTVLEVYCGSEFICHFLDLFRELV